jgi:hypothetical protein
MGPFTFFSPTHAGPPKEHVVLQVYFQALLRWGLWEEIISDHGGQFQSYDFARVNRRLGIHHEMYEKGQCATKVAERSETKSSELSGAFCTRPTEPRRKT